MSQFDPSAESSESSARLSRLVYAVVAPNGQLRLIRLRQAEIDTLAVLQDAVGGLIDLVRLGERLNAYVHDEGLSLSLPPNLVGTRMCASLALGRVVPPILAGPVVLVREDDEDPASLTPGQRLTIVDAWSRAIDDDPQY